MRRRFAVKKFVVDQDGAALAEYAVVLAVVVTAGVITAINGLGNAIVDLLNQAARLLVV